MASVTITIPSPIISVGSFAVVIKNTATGVNVYTGSQTNAPFTIVLPNGSYEMFTTYNGYTNGWCFDVLGCNCITYVSSEITESAPGVRHLVLTFDAAGWDGCPFVISEGDSSGGSSTVIISTLLDLTHVSGTTYTYTFFIGGASSSTFFVYNGISTTSTVCASATVSYSCSAAQLSDPLHPFDYRVFIEKISGVWYIRFRFWSCGDSCHYFTLHYKENYVMLGNVPDENTITITLNCSDPSPWEILVPINPVPTFYEGQGSLAVGDIVYLWYFLDIKDCCGNTLGLTHAENFTPYPDPG